MSENNTSLSLLSEQLTQLETLLQLLEKENEVLQHHDPDALNNLSAQKNELLIAIQTLDSELAKNQQFLQDKANGLCDQALSEIESALDRCKQLNTINGAIIQHSQLAVERMKTTLLEQNSKSSLTYDSKGKKSGGLSSIGIKA